VAGLEVGRERERDGEALGDDSSECFPEDPHLLEQAHSGVDQDHTDVLDPAEPALSGHLQLERLDPDLDPDLEGELLKIAKDGLEVGSAR
jgi:hypothetical protein